MDPSGSPPAGSTAGERQAGRTLESLLAEQSTGHRSSTLKKGGSAGAISACSKCGYSGHLTYQCRNFIPTKPNKVLIINTF